MYSGTPAAVIGEIVRLDQLVHHTALGDVQPEEIALVQRRGFHQLLAVESEAVDGEVFAQGAAVDPAVREHEVVVGHAPGALECFMRRAETPSG